MWLKAIPSRKVPPTPAPTTSKWGRNGEEPAASLRVRSGPKALRAVRGSFFKLWESKEKLASRNTPPAVRRTKGLIYKSVSLFIDQSLCFADKRSDLVLWEDLEGAGGIA